MPFARPVDVVIHDVPSRVAVVATLWAGRSDDQFEKDARLFGLEFWGTQRAETDPEKILSQLSEIGAPLAMTAGED